MLVEQNTLMVEEREREIRQIVQSISDLNEIFRDLGAMIVEQVRGLAPSSLSFPAVPRVLLQTSDSAFPSGNRICPSPPTCARMYACACTFT